MEKTTTTTISVQAFESLINTICSQCLPVGIRFRTRGDLWYPNFLRVVSAAHPIHFYDERRGNNIILPNLSAVIQFELDRTVQSFAPRCQYGISEDYFMEQ